MSDHLWTIGHSNRTLEDFVLVLESHRIQAVADVRRFAGSRRHPQFGLEILPDALIAAGIDFHHFPTLGGRRTSHLEPSPNAGWRVPAFRAYADYMLTEEFAKSFEELLVMGQSKRTAIMCAEVLPWRCHRRLVADQFVMRGWEVIDIIDARQWRRHELPSFAKVNGTELTYPGLESE